MAVGDILPKIEGFQPIPNAVMIPFMETQSSALAFGFGLNYEYGKRTIRSMSNETFNSLTSQQIAEMSASHSTILLNRFIQAVPQVMPAQTEIFKQYVEIEKAKVLQNVELAKWIATNAPSIITTGKTADTDIKTTPTTNFPPATTSSDVTSISQDAQGKITTTTKTSSTKIEKANPHYTIKYFYHATGSAISRTEKLDGWQNILKILRSGKPNTTDLKNITAISNFLKLATGKWY